MTRSQPNLFIFIYILSNLYVKGDGEGGEWRELLYE
jgi:hypothetical protein